MSDVLRAGIIGGGFMGGVHAHAVRAGGHRLTRVAGSTARSSADAARRLGADAAAESAEELIDCDDVDVVHICTPNVTHAPLAELAIKAGKHVVCEKPLATSVADARRLVESVNEAGVIGSVPLVYRFYPTVREARARIAAGEEGPLWLLHGSYLQDWLADREQTNWRVDSRLGGGSRAFGDIGVHWCDLMEYSTGHRVTRLVARFGTAHAGRRTPDGDAAADTEDGAVVLFETDRGAVGSVVVSQVSPGRKNRLWFSFDGTDGAYSFDQELPDTLWVGRTAANTIAYRGTETVQSPAAHRLSYLPAGHPQGYQDCFNQFVADTYAAVCGEQPEGLPTFADGLRAAIITDAVLTSARTHEWIEVPA